MPAYTRDIGRDFWYDFDNQTLWNRTQAVTNALQQAYFQNGKTLDSLADDLRSSFGDATHPQPFLNRVQPSAQGFIALGDIEWTIINAHLPSLDHIRSAFEDFGQGVLFDDRAPRPPGRRVHAMDGRPDSWVGYQRWYAMMRAAELVSGDARWLHLQRSLGLAWAIQTEVDPPEAPNNPGLPSARLSELRGLWMALQVNELDWAFAKYRFRAPPPSAFSAAGIQWAGAPQSGYARVQQILAAGAGNGQPWHDGQERFWEKTYSDFMSLPPIYGHQLIAPTGPNRADRSALVKVIEGTLPGVPRMPLNLPPLAAADIAFIRNWIDAGCPEV